MNATGSDLVLDTNAFIAWNEEDYDILTLMAAYGSFWIPLPTYGELRFGALRSARRQANLEPLARQLIYFRILCPAQATADAYARIRLHLKSIGRPIPANDLWIAAIAVEHGLPLLTRDAHFRHVPDLMVIGW